MLELHCATMRFIIFALTILACVPGHARLNDQINDQMTDHSEDQGGDPYGSGSADKAASTCKLLPSGYGPQGQVPIRVQKIATGLRVPWGIAFLSRDEFLVSERNGDVRLFRNGRIQPKVVVRVNVASRREGGLLGLVAHPRIEANGYFYVMYTFRKSSGDVNRVERYRLSADATSAVADKVIVDNIPSGKFHDGGRLRFGPDGMLYVGTGDARNPNLSQNPKSLSGKLLRVTDEGAIPSSNPSPGSRIFALGIRNMQAFDWIDSSHLVVADHGPTGELGRSGHDEVSILRSGSNMGWPTVWKCDQRSGFVTPLIAWKQAVPPGGLAYYTGSMIPEWRGSAVIGSLASKHLQVVQLDRSFGLVKHEVYLRGTYGRLREVIQAPDGSLYVTTSNCDGRGSCGAQKDMILRITK